MIAQNTILKLTLKKVILRKISLYISFYIFFNEPVVRLLRLGNEGARGVYEEIEYLVIIGPEQ